MATPDRMVVFVGHANPEDNTFAQWLSLRLAALGYQVWTDVTQLLGGEDFWRDIELIIRKGAIKYLYVLSRDSNQKPGVLKELRVATATARKENLRDYVIPLRIDDLPHDQTNIEVGRLNTIDFREWAPGLRQLREKLETDGVPRTQSNGTETVRRWWEREFAADSGVTEEQETHYSNWFPVQFPARIYRHSAIGLCENEPRWVFPTRWGKSGLVTFAPAAEVSRGFGTLRLQKSESLNLTEFLSEENPQRRENRDLVTTLLREAWEHSASARGLKKLEMAGGRPVFYFDLETLPDSRVDFVSVDGTNTYRGLMGYKTLTSGLKRHWHFAISAKPAVHPQPMLQVRAHVLFSDDGRTIWSSPTAMHRARRNQCKNWWNDAWRDRILATMAWLADDTDTFALPLSAGCATASVAARPLTFVSPVKLLEPRVATVEEEGIEEQEYDDPFKGSKPSVVKS